MPRNSTLPPLVGRHAEWRALQAAWTAAQQRRAQLVIIIGEAGIGKTRLAEELLSHADHMGARTAHAHTYAAAGQLAYAPLVAWLRTAALSQGIAALGDADLAELARLMPELIQERPGLAPPAPATESWQRLRMFEALARAILANRQPLLLVLNDLQWCDQETLDWLHFLLRHDPSAPLLVLATIRAEDAKADTLRAWWQTLEREEQVTLLELSALDGHATQAIAEQLSAGALSPDQAAQLYRQTEGNPLFVVELVRAAWGRGPIPATMEQPGATPFTALPARMQAVLQTRLAQLSPAAHELISLAAVVGRAFTMAVLAHASGERERSVVAALDELWQRRIVREQADGSYDFSHDKLREVAYAALSPARRRLHHRQVAEALEQTHAQRRDEVSGQIAAHYDQAGLPEQAVPYYHQSATAAHRVGALQEAAEQLERGLALVRGLPSTPQRIQRELELQVEYAATLMQQSGFAGIGVEQAYDRARLISQQVDPSATNFPILWGLHEVYLFQARTTQSRQIAEHLLTIAEQLDDPALILQGHHAMWGVLYHQFPDELELAIEHAQYGLANYDAQQHHIQTLHFGGHDTGICCRQVLTRSYWQLGYPDKARQYIQDVIDLSERLGHPFSQAMGLNNMATVNIYLRNIAEADVLATRAIAIAETYQLTLLRAEGRILQGWARVMQDQDGDWIRQIQHGIAEWNSLGSIIQQSYHQQLLAEVCLRTGQIEEALHACSMAIDLAHMSRETHLEADTYRLRGIVLLAMGAPAELAEKSFLQALTVARQLRSRSLELRASVSMARLWQSQGRHTDAYELLSAIYGWFTEGFDTVDLIEAKVLLDELSESLPTRSVG